MTGMDGAIMGGGAAGWMIVMLLIPILLVGLLAALVVWALRAGHPASAGHQTSPEATADAPLAILQRRYARGDIGADEYERIRAALTKG